MSGRISIAALREQAETGEPNTCPCDELAALTEAVEAAHRNWTDGGGSNAITHELRDHLARFDFGDEA